MTKEDYIRMNAKYGVGVENTEAGASFGSDDLAPHYRNAAGIDAWALMEAWFPVAEQRGGYLLGIFKYLQRYRKKAGIVDLHKCRDYLNQLIRLEESKSDGGQ